MPLFECCQLVVHRGKDDPDRIVLRQLSTEVHSAPSVCSIADLQPSTPRRYARAHTTVKCPRKNGTPHKHNS